MRLQNLILTAAAFLFCMFALQENASAATYYGQFQVLDDKSVRAYFDDAVARGHDGWCIDTGSVRSWDCFVTKDPAGNNPWILKATKGEEIFSNGVRSRAQLTQPFSGWKPYCHPGVVRHGNSVAKTYTCAYWVPAS